MVDRIQEQGRQELFACAAQHLWEEFVTQIKHDAGKMNAGINPKNAAGRPTMKGAIEINGRELIPGPHELHIDKLAFPSRDDGYFEEPTSLTVRLDIGARTIRTINKDSPATERWNSIEVIELHLADDNHICSEVTTVKSI